MHPSTASLIAFCDAEAKAGRGRRIAQHLAKCEQCRAAVGRIKSERDELSAGAAAPASDARPDLAALRSAIGAWQEGRNSLAASELRARLRWQIETYFGSRAASTVERPEMRAEEMLGKANEMIEVFLGPEAAEAVRDEVFRGVDWARRAEETCR